MAYLAAQLWHMHMSGSPTHALLEKNGIVKSDINDRTWAMIHRWSSCQILVCGGDSYFPPIDKANRTQGGKISVEKYQINTIFMNSSLSR